MADPAFIADGYEKQCYIAGVDRLHPEMRLTIRQMLQVDRGKYNKELAKTTGEAVEHEAAKLVQSRLISWDLMNGDGKVAPIRVEWILKLQPMLFSRIYDIVLGHDGGDPDPKAVDPPDDDEGDAKN